MQSVAAPRAQRPPAPKVDLSNPFTGPIAPVRHSPLYLLALSLVAILMVALPLIYLGLAAGVAYATYWHAVHDIGWLTRIRGSYSGRFQVAAYLGPIVAGLVLLFFMVKPIFARAARTHSGLVVRREDQPRLYEYVERVADLAGAPRPREIFLDCDVNASASFRRDWLGLLTGQLNLTIGLPLVAGMSLRGLTGVIAHEFGHFTQALGMRLTFVIITINQWFARVVYQRDRWDEYLESASSGNQGFISLIAGLARFGVWLTRRILWVLMVIGLLFSSFLQRQMEFDADAYQTRVAGSAEFANTVQRVKRLGWAYAVAGQQLSTGWQQRRMPDNLPALLVANDAALEEAADQKIEERIADDRTSWLASHPCFRDRIAAAQARNDPGVLRLAGAAAELFDNFDSVCRTLTFVEYSDRIGDAFKREHLIPTMALVGEHDERKKQAESSRQVFGAGFDARRPIRLERPATPFKDVRAAADAVKSARKELAVLGPQIEQALEAHGQGIKKLADAARAEVLLIGKVDFKGSDFGMQTSSRAEIDLLKRRGTELRRSQIELFVRYDRACSQRLYGIASLLASPAVARRIPGADALRAEMSKLLETAGALNIAAERVDPIVQHLSALQIGVEAIQRHPRNELIGGPIQTAFRSLHATLGEARADLRDYDYPFEHGSGNVSLSRYLIESIPGPDDAGAIYAAAREYLDRFGELAQRTFARLGAIAHAVETALAKPAA